jgi:TolA-binding protein
MRTRVIFTVFIFISFLCTPVFSQPVAVQNNATVGYCANLENEKIKYFNEFKYSGFIDFLDNYKSTDKTDKSCINYYKALTRYSQLNYLEEKQLWDEYFANGNNYREQIVDGVNKVIAETNSSDSLRSKSRLLIWQFHHGQQDAFYEQALVDLLTDVKAYAGVSKDIALIKYIADTLLSSGEKINARELYKLYVNKLVEEKMSDLELKNIAAGFYKEKNLELAQTVYDIYIERIAKTLSSDKLISELFEIAGFFVYKPIGLYDMAYAEKTYAKIEALGQKNVFNQEAIYLRAFNLEKMNAYADAQKFYLQLTQGYPDTKHFDEATYKIAMINVYALANINEAQKYFEILAAKTVASPHVISGLYQLGLLSQWQGDLAKASSYYDLLLKNAKNAQGKYAVAEAQARERIREIQENKPLSYNLKMFLDLSLKNESTLTEMNKAELRLSSYILEKNQNNIVSSYVNMPQSGCNQVELQYLWSGDLGGANPGVAESNFEGAYADPGTKEINMVIISPTGTIDRLFTMVDVY